MTIFHITNVNFHIFMLYHSLNIMLVVILSLYIMSLKFINLFYKKLKEDQNQTFVIVE